jgi:hypothetical protein
MGETREEIVERSLQRAEDSNEFLRAAVDADTEVIATLRAQLAAALSLLEEADRYFKEVAHVLDAAVAVNGYLLGIEGYGMTRIRDLPALGRVLENLRAALAALPVPPVEPTRATLQENGRSLEWPK